MPPDTRVLTIVPPAYLCTCITGFISSLLSIPKYAIDMANNRTGCSLDKNCTSFFLPGGLEIGRQVRPILNATILEGDIFNDTARNGGILDGDKVIQVNNAPGVLLRYERLKEC